MKLRLWSLIRASNDLPVRPMYTLSHVSHFFSYTPDFWSFTGLRFLFLICKPKLLHVLKEILKFLNRNCLQVVSEGFPNYVSE